MSTMSPITAEELVAWLRSRGIAVPSERTLFGLVIRAEIGEVTEIEWRTYAFQSNERTDG